MLTHNEEQPRETSFTEVGTQPQNQTTRAAVVRLPSGSSFSDVWSTTSDEDDGNKQVAENRPQVPTENGLSIFNTYERCEGVNSTVHNSNVFKDGVTINQNVYCCSTSLDYVLSWCTVKRGVAVLTIALLFLVLIISHRLWFSYLSLPRQTNDTEHLHQYVISTTPSVEPLYTIATPVFIPDTQPQTYEPPVPLIQPLWPIGIRMSIPDKKGITLVAFHVKVDHEFVGLEAGTIARDIIEVTNGSWTYYDTSTKLKLGDIIYYWIYVVYNGLGYHLLNKKHIVEDFYDYNGNKRELCIDQCNNSTIDEVSDKSGQTSSYVPPVPLIEPLLPRGIRMSIPDKTGISLVAFHVKVNQKFIGLEAGTIAVDVIRAINGRWTYYDPILQLKKGDIVYYWIHVIYNGLAYDTTGKNYTVIDFY